jgi:multidrug efflux pump subunit AcrB
MWIVRLALRRPLTVAVMAMLMLVMGVVSFARMSADIFPAINLPVVIIVWNYTGLPALDMERRVVTISERALSTTVNGIEHIESLSINGVGLIKIYFRPGTPTAGAIAQVSTMVETILKTMPPGIQAPPIVDYNAANVPVAQLNVYSETLSEQQLFDYGLNFIRVRLFTIEGLSAPAPFGGVQRQVMVNLNPEQLYANGLSPQDVVGTLLSSNVIMPAGTVKIGNKEYDVLLNGSPQRVQELNRLPIRMVDGAPVFVGDVAPVTDSHAVQTNIVRVDGRRATFIPILKHADASTISVIDSVKKVIPLILETAPKGLKLKMIFDQSVFVRQALWDVVREAGVAAFLVAMMVLLFLGSWRSTLIVITSIPLSILTSIIFLNLSGQSINIMTLGGLALAVGMLVDDATVEVENIHRNHAMNKTLLVAILDGAHQIAAPAFVGTLAICIVFAPVVLLVGVAKYLFIPLALAVVYSMLTSYLLSRTLVPSMARRLLADQPEGHKVGGWLGRFTDRFDAGFERMKDRYRRLLGMVVMRRGLVLGCIALVVIASGVLVKVTGQDFFPSVDAGMMRLHVRAATGTRIEESERIVQAIEERIREVIPPAEFDSISDTIGLPIYYDLAFYQTDSVGPQDADVLISLKPRHHPTAGYMKAIREAIRQDFPGVQIYFQAADIVSQVLNFGLSGPIDVQVSGLDLNQIHGVAQDIKRYMQTVPGLTDIRIQQLLDYPTIRLNIDRARALELGVSMNDVASSMLTSLSSSFLVSPNFWLDPRNGVNYNVAAQTPQHIISSLGALGNTPIAPAQRDGTRPAAQFLSNLATVSHDVIPSSISHYTVQRTIDVNCNVEGRDLGSASGAVESYAKAMKNLPPGTRIKLLGQSDAMRESFGSLGQGLILAVILVYLLMVANFQSWLEPFIIMLAVPGALAGVLWMLVLTGTTLNVESLMGAIMAVGVGVANGNLVITFANELREQGYSAINAAIEAGRIRLRPVIMTALAMILGMLPTALGKGQNGPLGRAVIGGLILATLMTLFVVPTVYSIFGRNLITKAQRDAEVDDANLPGA